MARSRYIYVVRDQQNAIRAAFTVAHEMSSALNRALKGDEKVVEWWVERYRDGWPVTTPDYRTQVGPYLTSLGD